MYTSVPVTGSQPMSTVRTTNYQYTVSHPLFEKKSASHNTTIISDSIKSDFGKIKAIEVLYFRAAQLERTINGQNKFAAVGPLQVLYFPQYDRFVLSLNSWKYPLLKRIPIVGSSASHSIPVTYTLPTVNGFFSLTIAKVEYLEALHNLELIFAENAKFTHSDSEDVLHHGGSVLGAGHSTILAPTIQQTPTTYLQAPRNYPMNGNMMQGSLYSPRATTGTIGQSFTQSFQTNVVQPVTVAPKKQSRWRRIFSGPEYNRDKGDRTGTSRHNLNMIQKRDIGSMKMTSEVMAAAVYYPRKEVERWIIYNKEMANLMNFSPELQDQDFDAFGHSSMNRSQMDVDPTLPCNQPITSDRPIDSVTYQVGRNFTSAVRRDGKKTDGYISGHSHSIHPDVSGRFNNLSTSRFEPDRFRSMTNTDPLYEATGISPIQKISQPYTFIQDDILEDSRPSITDKMKSAFSNTNETKHFETLRQQEKLMSFADKDFIQPTPLGATNVVGETATFIRSPRAVESNTISHVIATETLQPSTQYVSTALPTLQERIRNTPKIAGVDGDIHPSDIVHTHYAA